MRYTFDIPWIMKPLLLPFGATESTCYADLGDEALEVRMGVLFHHVLPISCIGSVERAQWPWYFGLGVRIGMGRQLGVLASTQNVVRVQFKGPTEVPLFLGLKMQVHGLCLALQGVDGFVQDLESRLT